MGFVVERKVDELGRVVLPRELRAKLGIHPQTPLTIAEEDGRVILLTRCPACRICGARMDPDDEYVICRSCIADIKTTDFDFSADIPAENGGDSPGGRHGKKEAH